MSHPQEPVPQHFYQKLNNVFLISLSLSLTNAWFFLYYEAGSLINRVSFQASDPSWVPPGTKSSAVIGKHYFGDLQLFLAWAQTDNPYNVDLPAQYMPLAQLLLNPFSLMESKLSFVFYFLISMNLFFISSYYFVTYLVLPSRYNLRFVDWLPTFLLTSMLVLPTLVDFDRGNLYILSTSSLLLSLTQFKRGKFLSGYILGILSFTFKPYFLLIIIIAMYFLIRVKLILVIKLLLISAVANILCLMFFPGSILTNIESLINANLRYGGTWGLGYIMNSGSAVGSVSRLLEQKLGSETAYEILLQESYLFPIFLVMYVFLVCFVIKRLEALHDKLLAIFSLISIPIPGSGSYTWIWLSFVAIAFAFSRPDNKKWNWKERIFVLILLLGLVPIWYVDSSLLQIWRPYPQYLILSPLIISYIIICAISPTFTQFAKKKKRDSREPFARRS